MPIDSVSSRNRMWSDDHRARAAGIYFHVSLAAYVQPPPFCMFHAFQIAEANLRQAERICATPAAELS